MLPLEGKTILVTGAARGIGAATSKAILSQGGNIIMHLNQNRGCADALIAEYGNDRVLTVVADFTKSNEVDELFVCALAWASRIDAIVNNAGLIEETSVIDDMEKWRRRWHRTITVNVQALADLCKLGIEHFQKNGGGALVNISSRAGFRGDSPDFMHYAASKGAVVALTRSIAKGYAKERIYAYNVAPGWIKTERVSPIIDAPENSFMMDEIPMGEAAPPEEVANIVTFLLAGKATHATGSTFDINGASYFH